MFIPNAIISKTFTKEQIDYLKEIYDCCIEEFEASSKELTPLSGLISMNWNWTPTQLEISNGLKMLKDLGVSFYNDEDEEEVMT